MASFIFAWCSLSKGPRGGGGGGGVEMCGSDRREERDGGKIVHKRKRSKGRTDTGPGRQDRGDKAGVGHSSAVRESGNGGQFDIWTIHLSGFIFYIFFRLKFSFN